MRASSVAAFSGELDQFRIHGSYIFFAQVLLITQLMLERCPEFIDMVPANLNFHQALFRFKEDGDLDDEVKAAISARFRILHSRAVR